MFHPIAIIDIGSNSVRLVVYGGAWRAPVILFNEKVAARLGARLGDEGRLAPEARAATLRALRRFRVLISDMGISHVDAIATAAVREAVDGAEFLDEMRATGVDVQIISGEREAELAAYGVLSATPDADGLVGDLGGGSLELARVADGKVGARVSLPLGVLRLAPFRGGANGGLAAHVRKLLAGAQWPLTEKNLAFYMVGGSWRAVARVHMALTNYSLPVLEHYSIPIGDLPILARSIASSERKQLKAIRGLPSARLADLTDAAALLAELARVLALRSVTVSTTGVREGLLYDRLSPEDRALDPLLVAAREVAVRAGRFDEHGELLDRWIAPLFPIEAPRDLRLRRMACHLADAAWAVAPDFRAARGIDVALHERWTAIDARGRVMVAQALASSFGGASQTPDMKVISQLAAPEDMLRAEDWGLAMRFGQRLSGGVARPLQQSRLSVAQGELLLHLGPGAEALYGEAVQRRHEQLAARLQLTAHVNAS